MSGTTGNPLNLNKFDGGDDIVDALTRLFNQNMDILNKATANAGVWAPSTHYNQWDIVQNRFEGITMISTQDHTSSNADNRTDWGTKDGSKWIYLTNFPKINQYIQNQYMPSGSAFLDGNGLKYQDTGSVHPVIDRTESHFLSSRIENWTPQTKYNPGDLVYIGSMNTTWQGTLQKAVLRARVPHTSDTTFPASSDGLWDLINLDAYAKAAYVSFGWGRDMLITRIGSSVVYRYGSSTGKWEIKKPGADMSDKLPGWANPDIYGNDAYIYMNQSPWFGTAGEWTLSLHNNANNSRMQAYVKDIPASDIFRGSVTGQTTADPEWPAGVPTF